MSHDIQIPQAEKDKYGVPDVRSLPALQRACAKHEHRLEWVDNYHIGLDRATGRSTYVTGWAIDFKVDKGAGDAGWVKKVVYGKPADQVKRGERFQLDDEGVDEHFDNYSPYHATHQAVIKGEKRVGENGQWGNIKYLWQLHDDYKAACFEIMYEVAQRVSQEQGLAPQVEVDDDEKLVLTFDQDVGTDPMGTDSLDAGQL